MAGVRLLMHGPVGRVGQVEKREHGSRTPNTQQLEVE
jgi:hypothetical protein